MNSCELIMIGAGGHAKSCIEVIESVGEYSVAQIVGKTSEVGSTVLGHTISYTDEDLPSLRKKYKFAFIGIGQIQNADPRINMFRALSELGFKFPSFVAKSASVSRSARIGEGSIIMNGAILNTDCLVGKNVIVNSGSLIEHDVHIGDNSHISTSVTLNGGVRIGQGTFLGSGTLVSNGINIGENSFVGIGSVIAKSLPSNSKYKITG